MQKHPNNRHLWKQINSPSTASLLPIFPSLRYPSPKLAAASFRHSLPQALCSQERSHDSVQPWRQERKCNRDDLLGSWTNFCLGSHILNDPSQDLLPNFLFLILISLKEDPQNYICLGLTNGFPGGAGDVRDTGSILGSGRSPGEGHGNPLQYSCLENPMDRGAWRLLSIGLQRVGHDWSDLACTHAGPTKAKCSNFSPNRKRVFYRESSFVPPFFCFRGCHEDVIIIVTAAIFLSWVECWKNPRYSNPWHHLVLNHP